MCGTPEENIMSTMADMVLDSNKKSLTKKHTVEEGKSDNPTIKKSSELVSSMLDSVMETLPKKGNVGSVLDEDSYAIKDAIHTNIQAKRDRTDEGAKQIGALRARTGSSGVDVDSGSVKAIVEEEYKRLDEDKKMYDGKFMEKMHTLEKNTEKEKRKSLLGMKNTMRGMFKNMIKVTL